MKKIGTMVLAFALASGIAVSGFSEDAVKKETKTVRNVADYGAKGDGVTDDTEAIQKCIDDGYTGVWSYASLIIFPAGKTYRVSHTIVVWSSIRIETDQENPATILLASNTPGFTDPSNIKPVMMSRLTALRQDKVPADFDYRTDPRCKGGVPNPTPCWPWKWPEDYDSVKFDQHKVHPSAGPGNNFWSQVLFLKFRIEAGNPGAAVLYWVAAQGSYLHGLNMELNDAAFGVIGGSYISDSTFNGGRVAVYDTSWSEFGFVVNCKFTNQLESAYGEETFARRVFINDTFENMPIAIQENNARNLFVLGCTFKDVSVGIDFKNRWPEVILQNVTAENCPVIYRDPAKIIPGRPAGKITIPTYVRGDVFTDGNWIRGGGMFATRSIIPTTYSIPKYDRSKMVNVKDFGAVGDAKADDTEAFRKAIAAAEAVFIPGGQYLLKDTVMLGPKTKLIGESTALSAIMVAPGTPGFIDQANPKPLLDTPDDANAEILIANISMHCLTQGGWHGYDGCIGLRWRAGRKSAVVNCAPNAGANPVFITGNGGGTFINLWTACSGLWRGIVIDHNKEPLLFIGSSSEHQTDKAVLMNGAKDVTFIMSGGGEGDYTDRKVMNEFTDCERIAWIYMVANPGDLKNDKDVMTIVKMNNCKDFWIGPIMRIHDQPVLHTLYSTQSDGKVIDMKNGAFTLLLEGEVNSEMKPGLIPEVISLDGMGYEIQSPYVSVNNDIVEVVWENPGAFDAVKVIRNFERPPKDMTDGEAIYEGDGNSVLDKTGRSKGLAWYGIFGKYKNGTYSKGIKLSAALGSSSYIRNWLALGFFEAPDRDCSKGYEKAFIDEANTSPLPGQKCGELAWEKVPSSAMSGDFVDFLTLFHGRKDLLLYMATYLHTYVWSDEALECNMLLGIDDGYKIWLNGKYVGGLDRGGVPCKDDFTIPVSLKKGWNSLLFKITQGGGNWMLCARFVMPDGSSPKTGIRSSIDKK